MKTFQVFLLMCCFFGQLSAQDELGIAGSMHSPVNTVLNNPSTIVDSRAFIDINIAGINAYAINTLAYIPGSEFSFSNLKNIKGVSYNRNTAPYSAYADVRVSGPGVVFAVKQHAFGIQTAFRTVADVRGVPETLGYYMTEGFQYRPQMGVEHTVKDLRASGMSWLETGISYGTIVSRGGDMITQAGITVKRLFGVAGVGMRVDDWRYTIQDSSNMKTTRFTGEYGFNDPGMSDPNIINGKGWGMDIGITFKQRKSSSETYKPHSPCTDGDYRYRFGFSLLDLGKIRFNGPVYNNKFDRSEEKQWQDFSGTSADDLSDLDSLLVSGLGAAKSNTDKAQFSMMLPAALSAQIDYNLGHNIYVYGVVTGGLPWKNRLGVERASYLGVAPRWETRRLEVAVPLSMYQFRKPQVGLMMRLNNIIIGSDNLGWLFFNGDVYGADVYVSIKYTIFRHPGCRNKKAKAVKVVKPVASNPLPCPAW